eukprot:jgi/Ulvmu1/93/UM001_0096.1
MSGHASCSNQHRRPDTIANLCGTQMLKPSKDDPLRYGPLLLFPIPWSSAGGRCGGCEHWLVLQLQGEPDSECISQCRQATGSVYLSARVQFMQKPLQCLTMCPRHELRESTQDTNCNQALTRVRACPPGAGPQACPHADNNAKWHALPG